MWLLLGSWRWLHRWLRTAGKRLQELKTPPLMQPIAGRGEFLIQSAYCKKGTTMDISTYPAVNFDPCIPRPSRDLAAYEQASGPLFFGVSALLFAVSAALTVLWCNSMSAMGGMPMPGGWTMSMAWMRMPGQTWAGAAASFVGMWIVMMLAMMLPSSAPMLWRYYQSVERGCETPRGQLASLAGLGYFFVWTLIGLAAFPVGIATAAVEMEQPMLARAVPVAAGFMVVLAGALQFTKWKAHHLARCRKAPKRGSVMPSDAVGAWRLGACFGLHCGLSCANLTAILLVAGVMDLRVMTVVTAAISAERLLPGGEKVARAIGFAVVGAGVMWITRAIRLI
jgi:predicted metal-binding membrane protein